MQLVRTRPIIAAAVVMSCCACASTRSKPALHPSNLPITYHNSHYGLRFFVPESWRGYSVLLKQWHADPSISNAHGPIIVLRSPKWRPSHPCQDIPILVFTRRQWAIEQGPQAFGIFAGGVEEEISHNDRYVFAIWSRFNFDEISGSDETQRIVDANIEAGKPHLPESQD